MCKLKFRLSTYSNIINFVIKKNFLTKMFLKNIIYPSVENSWGCHLKKSRCIGMPVPYGFFSICIYPPPPKNPFQFKVIKINYLVWCLLA